MAGGGAAVMFFPAVNHEFSESVSGLLSHGAGHTRDIRVVWLTLHP